MKENIERFVDTIDLDKSYILVSENATLIKGSSIECFALIGKVLESLKDSMNEKAFKKLYEIIGMYLEGKD